MGFDPMTHCVLVDDLPTELYIHTYTRAAELAGMNHSYESKQSVST